MIKLGEMQELEVVKKQDFGIYLKSSDDKNGDNKILLPIKQVPEGTEVGDKLNVFVYRDSSDRIIATVNKPKLVIGEIGYLKVVELSNIGAFLNWGLEKDLFLPFKEQIGELKNGGEYMVGLYVDKSDRLCATMNMFKVLRTDSPYKINDVVNGTVFSLKRGLGAMVAVEGKYLGLIHEGEILKELRSGDEVELRVSNIKEDGKLDLSFKDAPKLQIDRDGDKVFSILAKNKGFLPLNDDSSPEKIIEMLNMSKSSFKKALGRLLKKRIIEITQGGIKLAERTNTTETDQRNYSRKSDSRDNYKKSGSKDGYKKFDNKDGYKKPDSKDGYKKFDNKDGYKKPDSKDGYKKFDNKDGYKKPDSKDGYKKFDNKDSYKKPDSKDGYKKFDNKDSYKKPDSKDGYKKFDNKDSYKKPDSKDGYKKFDNKDSYKKPDSKDGYKKFDNKDSYKKPDSKDGYKKFDNKDGFKKQENSFSKDNRKNSYTKTTNNNKFKDKR